MEEEGTSRFTRKEKEHIEALQRRLDYLRSQQARQDHAEGAGGYIAGEVNALAWLLLLVELHGEVTPEEIRLERMFHQIRKLGGKVGRIEQELWPDDDDA